MVSVTLRKRNFIVRAFALLSALWLAACNGVAIPGASSGQSIDPSRPVPVALMVPGGSGGAGDAVLARTLENAARMALRDMSGANVDLRVYNTAGSPAQASQAAAQAIADGARIILGPLYKEAALSAAHVAAQQNVLVLSFSNTSSIAGNNLYVLGELYETRANRLVSYAARQGITRFYMANADKTPELAINAIRQAIARNGAQLVGATAYPLSQIDVLNATDQIAAQANAAGAQAVITTAGVGAELAILGTTLPEKGLSPARTKIIGLTKWNLDPSASQLPGLQGGLFAMADTARLAQFDRNYRAAYGAEPHPLAPLAYDGMSAIAQLIATGKRDALSSASLTRRTGFTGASGAFRMLPNGLNERALSVASFQDGQTLILSPAPSSFGRGTN